MLNDLKKSNSVCENFFERAAFYQITHRVDKTLKYLVNLIIGLKEIFRSHQGKLGQVGEKLGNMALKSKGQNV